jgi:hypothetical protein
LFPKEQTARHLGGLTKVLTSMRARFYSSAIHEEDIHVYQPLSPAGPLPARTEIKVNSLRLIELAFSRDAGDTGFYPTLPPGTPDMLS